MIVNIDYSQGILVLKEVTNPKQAKELVDHLLEIKGYQIISNVFDHPSRTWTFVLKALNQTRPISGPDNDYGLPETDFI